MMIPDRREMYGTNTWAVSVLAAIRARTDTEVVGFREQVLNGELMNWDEVPSWVEKQATLGPPTTYLTLPMEQQKVRNQKFEVDLRTPSGMSFSARVLKYAGPDDESVRLQPTRRGPLERLRQVSISLAESFAWMESQAAVFVLTDIVPLLSPIRVTSSGEAIRDGYSIEWAKRITLEIDPSVSPNELVRAYQQVRLEGGHDRRRRLSEKHAMLAIFTAERPETQSWIDTLTNWNAERPEWRYNHVSNFRRDAVRAQARLLYPDRFHGQTRLRS